MAPIGARPSRAGRADLSHLHALELAAHVAKDELKERDLPPETFDYGGARHDRAPTPFVLRAAVGHGHAGSGACRRADAVAGLRHRSAQSACGVQEIEAGHGLDGVRHDRRPHLQRAAGLPSRSHRARRCGYHRELEPRQYGHDPLARVLDDPDGRERRRQVPVHLRDAARRGLARTEQYQDATKDDHAFQKTYMRLPFEVPDKRYRKTVAHHGGRRGCDASSTKEGIWQNCAR